MKLRFKTNPFTRVTTSAYMPEVDGLRFLAIAWVVLFHILGSFIKKTPAHVDSDNGLYTILLNGDQGVMLFFMISGFILCLPFAKHYVLGQKAVSLKSYYFRRVVRIEPPYVIVALVIAALYFMRSAYAADVILPHLGATLIYMHSIIYHQTSLINVVFWSLEVEIQFYILAPLLTLVYFSMAPVIRRAIVIALILVLPFIQLYTDPVLPLTLVGFLQYFIAGFLICDLYVMKENKLFVHSTWVGAIALVVLLLVNFHHSLPEKILLPFLMMQLFLSALFNTFWKNIFGKKYLAIIGGMCYSIYLIHFQLIGLIGDFTMPFAMGDNFYLNFLLQCLLIIPMMLLVCCGFFILVEKPFMGIRLKEKNR